MQAYSLFFRTGLYKHCLLNRDHNVNTSNLIHTVEFSQLVCTQREHNGGSTSHGANAPYSSKSLSFGYNPQFGRRLALLHKVNIKDLMSHGGLGFSEVVYSNCGSKN